MRFESKNDPIKGRKAVDEIYHRITTDSGFKAYNINVEATPGVQAFPSQTWTKLYYCDSNPMKSVVTAGSYDDFSTFSLCELFIFSDDDKVRFLTQISDCRRQMLCPDQAPA